MNWIEKTPDPPSPFTHTPYKAGVKKLKREGGREGRKSNLGQYLRYGIQTWYDGIIMYGHTHARFDDQKKNHAKKEKEKSEGEEKKEKSRSATLLQLAFLRESDPNVAWENSQWNNTVKNNNPKMVKA